MQVIKETNQPSGIHAQPKLCVQSLNNIPHVPSFSHTPSLVFMLTTAILYPMSQHNSTTYLCSLPLSTLAPPLRNTLATNLRPKNDILTSLPSLAEEKRRICLAKALALPHALGFRNHSPRCAQEKITRCINVIKAFGDTPAH